MAERLSALLARDLRARGTEVVFGLLTDETMNFVAALVAEGLRFVASRQETQAVLMAEGYSFATGRLGIAVVGRGPASTNAVTGSVYASRTGSKVLIILGDAATDEGAVNVPGPDIKRIDGLGSAGIYAAAGIRTFPIASADSARPLLAKAAAYAELGRAATLHLPTNLQDAPAEDHGPGATPPPEPAAPVAPPAPAIEAAAAQLARSERPLILAGWGAFAAGAKPELEALAERTGAVLCTSLKGKDLFRGHPYDLGVIGSFSHSAGRRMIDQADCVLAVGAGLNLFTTSFGTALPRVPVIQIDALRSSIGRWLTSHIAVVGDAKLAAAALLDALPERTEKPFHSEETRRLLSEFRHTNDFADQSSPRNIDSRTLALELDRILPEQRTVVYDAGNFLGVVPYLSVPDPHHLKMTSESASIGLGFGTALGVACARPDTTTVLVIGDGGLLMTLGELETVVREDLPLVIVVMNDRAYGAERHLLELRGLPIANSVFPEADYAATAAALGHDAHTIAALGDLTRLQPLLANPDRPILLDCLIDPTVRAPFITEMAEVERRAAAGN